MDATETDYCARHERQARRHFLDWIHYQAHPKGERAARAFAGLTLVQRASETCVACQRLKGGDDT